MRRSRALVCASIDWNAAHTISMANKTCDVLNMHFTALQDPSTTENFVSAVENSCLTGGYRSLRFDELDVRAVVWQWCDRRRGRLVTITNPHARFDWFSWIIKSNPVDACCHEFIAQQFIVISNDDTIVCGVDVEHVKRPGVRDADAATLPYRVAMNARMLADAFAG